MVKDIYGAAGSRLSAFCKSHERMVTRERGDVRKYADRICRARPGDIRLAPSRAYALRRPQFIDDIYGNKDIYAPDRRAKRQSINELPIDAVARQQVDFIHGPAMEALGLAPAEASARGPQRAIV
jgi:hypothetical protein